MKRFRFIMLLCIVRLCNICAQTIPEGVYIIRYAESPNFVFDLDHGISANQRNVLLWGYHGSNNQKWRVTHTTNGATVFKSMQNNNFALTVAWSTLTDGTNMFTKTVTPLTKNGTPNNQATDKFGTQDTIVDRIDKALLNNPVFPEELKVKHNEGRT